MKFGFAARLSWVLALSGILTTGIIGLYAYRASHDLLVKDAIEELSANAVVMENRLSSLRKSIARDLNLLANHPDSRAILQGQTPRSDGDIETLFELLMVHNPSYLQIRLIAARDFGLEIIRVDRDQTGLVRVTGDELQEKGHFLYVSETLKLRPGNIYVSPIVINHERGAHAGLNRPTSIFAAPVVDGTGQTQGVVVLNLDLNNAFEALAADLPRHFRYFLTKQEGDFLIHPDPSRTFGFDRGQRILLQDEFPAAAALVEGKAPSIIVEAQAGRYADEPLVMVFVRDTDPTLFGANTLFLGVGEPKEQVLGKADAMGKTIIAIAIAVSVAGALLAMVLARYITLPINRLTHAVQHFGNDQDAFSLPIRRRDELGQLARSFLEMRDKIRTQFELLEKNNREMEKLSQLDSLTGLFNRRKLDEALEREFSRSMRFHNELSVIIMDIDYFKAVNDMYGHQVGDNLLRHISLLLQSNIRETDILGRWGGEEFLIISPENGLEGATVLAEKLRRIVSESEMPGVGAKTCSFGVATRCPGERENNLVARADAALYEAKKQGRNRVMQAEVAS